jgi:hypothetical protein
MSTPNRCPDCDRDFDRRDFLKVAAAGISAPLLLNSSGFALAEDKPAGGSQPETSSDRERFQQGPAEAD